MTADLKPILTGHCNPSNPPEIHDQCSGEIQGHPCACGHHAALGSLTILPDLEQGTPEWHDQRRGLVTASVVGQLLTPGGKVASSETSRGLATRLFVERLTGTTDDTFQNADMLRGVMEEPRARDRYAEVNGVKVDQIGFAIRLIPGVGTIGASPDGLVGDDGGIEVKSPRAKGHVTTVLSGEIPPAHMPQIQGCLLVLGRQWWDFISWHGGLPMWTKRVEPDQNMHDAILEAVAALEADIASLHERWANSTKHLPTTERMSFFDEIVI